MTVHYEDELVTLHHGDCLDVLRALPDASVDSVVTDPPYDLTAGKKGGTGAASVNLDSPYGRSRISTGNGGFMGKDWDATGIAFDPATWVEVMRVLKPGGHLLAFGGSRTWHRLAVAVEDAGFELRDSIAWLYGSGFPKSLDVSKAIDRRKDWTALPLLQAKVRAARTALGISQSEAARRVGLIGPDETLGGGGFMWFETGMRVPTRDQYHRLKMALGLDNECDRAFEEAEREVVGTYGSGITRGASGAGGGGEGGDRTAPATEAAETWAGWGTALKPAFEPIVVGRKPLVGTVAANVLAHGTGALNIDACRTVTTDSLGGGAATKGSASHTEGWDRPWKNDPEAVAAHAARVAGNVVKAEALGRWPTNVVLDDTQAVELDAQTGVLTSGANPTRRGSDKFRDAYGEFAGQDECTPSRGADSGGASRFFPTFRYEAKAPTDERPRDGAVAHPTVKPLDLMRWLVRLVTPGGGLVLDPFAGSGTTAEACVIEGFRCITIEREAQYLPLIVARLTKPIQPDLFGGAA